MCAGLQEPERTEVYTEGKEGRRNVQTGGRKGRALLPAVQKEPILNMTAHSKASPIIIQFEHALHLHASSSGALKKKKPFRIFDCHEPNPSENNDKPNIGHAAHRSIADGRACSVEAPRKPNRTRGVACRTLDHTCVYKNPIIRGYIRTLAWSHLHVRAELRILSCAAERRGNVCV